MPVASGVQLTKGWNEVTYGGTTSPIEEAIASIRQYLVRVWIQRGDRWYMYDPADPVGSDLKTIYTEELVWVDVTQDAYWSWPITGVQDLVEITSLGMPASAKTEELVEVKATLKNIGTTTLRIRAELSHSVDKQRINYQRDTVRPTEATLDPSKSAQFLATFAMPAYDSTVFCSAQYWDGAKWIESNFSSDTIKASVAISVWPIALGIGVGATVLYFISKALKKR